VSTTESFEVLCVVSMSITQSHMHATMIWHGCGCRNDIIQLYFVTCHLTCPIGWSSCYAILSNSLRHLANKFIFGSVDGQQGEVGLKWEMENGEMGNEETALLIILTPFHLHLCQHYTGYSWSTFACSSHCICPSSFHFFPCQHHWAQLIRFFNQEETSLPCAQFDSKVTFIKGEGNSSAKPISTCNSESTFHWIKTSYNT